jgi:hypothetical protein
VGWNRHCEQEAKHLGVVGEQVTQKIMNMPFRQQLDRFAGLYFDVFNTAD